MQAPPTALLLSLPGACPLYTLGRAVQGLSPCVPFPDTGL